MEHTDSLKYHNQIYFYGCSFSDGGGLNNHSYIEWYNKQNGTKVSNEPSTALEFSNSFRFSNIISDKLGCDMMNFSTTANNNEKILYDLWSNISTPKTIHIVQWSFPVRKYYWDERTHKFYRLQGLNDFNQVNIFDENDKGTIADHLYDKELDNLKKHYLDSLLHYTNINYEEQKLSMMSELLYSYSNQNDIPIYFLPWDKQLKTLPNFILESMGEWAVKNKMQIVDETDGYYVDFHLSISGNKIISDIILNKFKDDGLI